MKQPNETAPSLTSSGAAFSRTGQQGSEVDALVLDILVEREEMDEPQYVVRRITPVEAERLQGFPDGWTDIEYNGRPAPDTLRYKALGNSMTCTVMRWLAERILEADKNGD